MQVASRKSNRQSRAVAEVEQSRVQVAPQRNSRQSQPVAEVERRNSAVCTIKNNPFRLLFFGIEQHHSQKTLRKDQLKTEHNWSATIPCLL
jgi:hypothetical protein